MTLKAQLNNDLKAAMKSGDETRKSTLRGVLAAIKQIEIDGRAAASAGSELTEEGVISVLQKEAKSRRESMADAAKAERTDLAAGYQAELTIIEAYLPQALTRAELTELARAAIAEANATSAKQLGAVMKILSPRTKGRADGKLVNEVVRELLGD